MRVKVQVERTVCDFCGSDDHVMPCDICSKDACPDHRVQIRQMYKKDGSQHYWGMPVVLSVCFNHVEKQITDPLDAKRKEAAAKK